MIRSFLPLSRPLALAAVAACALVLPAAAHAEWDAGVRAGYYSDTEEAFRRRGADRCRRLRLVLQPQPGIRLRRSRRALHPQRRLPPRLLERRRLERLGRSRPVARLRESRRGDDETDFGVNVLAGLGARRGAVRPSVQGKVLIADETEAVLGVGVRFF